MKIQSYKFDTRTMTIALHEFMFWGPLEKVAKAAGPFEDEIRNEVFSTPALDLFDELDTVISSEIGE